LLVICYIGAVPYVLWIDSAKSAQRNSLWSML